jgi:hypothetical protein
VTRFARRPRLIEQQHYRFADPGKDFHLERDKAAPAGSSLALTR